MVAMKRLSTVGLSSAAASQLANDVSEYKRVAEDVSSVSKAPSSFF